MANDEGNIVADDDEKFELVFGTSGFKRDINAIRNNDPRWVSLTFTYGNRDAPRFSNLAWQLLGRYIANNRYLDRVELGYYLNISDEIMALFFRGLTSSSSLQSLDVDGRFGTDGIRSWLLA